MRLKLKRVSSSKECTMGVIINEDTGIPILTTLELPWKDNQHNISCIPAGTYSVKKFADQKHFRKAFIIENVPNRDGILIHAGNIVDDSRGCILVGKSYGEYKNKPAVSLSIIGLDELNNLFDRNKVSEFTLIIES